MQLSLPRHQRCGTFTFEFDIFTSCQEVHQTSLVPQGTVLGSDGFYGNDFCSNSTQEVFLFGSTIYEVIEKLDDDEIRIFQTKESSSTIRDASDGITKSLDNEHFLVGTYDDKAAFSEARRKCQPFIPRDRNEIRVVVLRARDLRAMDQPRIRACSGMAQPGSKQLVQSTTRPQKETKLSSISRASDPFVSLRVHGTDNFKEQTTSAMSSTLNPEWGEQFILSAPEPALCDSGPPCLELTVRDQDAYSSNDFMGRALFPLGGSELPIEFKQGHVSRCWLQLQAEKNNLFHASKVNGAYVQ